MENLLTFPTYYPHFKMITNYLKTLFFILDLLDYIEIFMFDYSIIMHFRFLIDLMTDVISFKKRIEILNPCLAEA